MKFWTNCAYAEASKSFQRKIGNCCMGAGRTSLLHCLLPLKSVTSAFSLFLWEAEEWKWFGNASSFCWVQKVRITMPQVAIDLWTHILKQFEWTLWKGLVIAWAICAMGNECGEKDNLAIKLSSSSDLGAGYAGWYAKSSCKDCDTICYERTSGWNM